LGIGNATVLAVGAGFTPAPTDTVIPDFNSSAYCKQLQSAYFISLYSVVAFGAAKYKSDILFGLLFSSMNSPYLPGRGKPCPYIIIN
jgi:hypothetical protein